MLDLKVRETVSPTVRKPRARNLQSTARQSVPKFIPPKPTSGEKPPTKLDQPTDEDIDDWGDDFDDGLSTPVTPLVPLKAAPEIAARFQEEVDDDWGDDFGDDLTDAVAPPGILPATTFDC